MNKREVEQQIRRQTEPAFAAKGGVITLQNELSKTVLGDLCGRSLREWLGFVPPVPSREGVLRCQCRCYETKRQAEILAQGAWHFLTVTPLPEAAPNPAVLMNNIETIMRRRLAALLPNVDSLEHLMLEGGGRKNPSEQIRMAERYLAEARRGVFALMNLADMLHSETLYLRGELCAVFRPTELCALADSIYGAVRLIAAPLGVEIKLFRPDEALHATLDDEMLESALYGLLACAVSHTQAGNAVGLTLKQTDDKLLIAVSDGAEGRGDSNFGERFAPDSARSLHTIHLETGLPLAVSFAQTHGGKLILESGADKTAVSLLLPLFRKPTATELRDMRIAYDGGHPKPLVALAGVANQNPIYLKRNFRNPRGSVLPGGNGLA